MDDSSNGTNTSVDGLLGHSTNLPEVELGKAIVVSTAVVLMGLLTGGGNMLVFISIAKDSKLHTLSNKLIASLAVTDTMVVLIVLPFAAGPSVLGYWPFGNTACDIFITADVLLCTNSILHLVTIAIDRYWIASDITYRQGDKRHDYLFPVGVTATWLLSAAVCLPPFFGWQTEHHDNLHCIISQDLGYTVYSTMSAFYVPLAIIIIIYTRVFYKISAIANKKRTHGKTSAAKVSTMKSSRIEEQKISLLDKDTAIGQTTPMISKSNGVNLTEQEGGDNTSRTTVSNKNSSSQDESNNNYKQELEVQLVNGSEKNKPQVVEAKLFEKRSKRKESRMANHEKEKKTKAQKKEKRALVTLIIITGIFAGCWLPFFLLAIILPFCGEYCVNDWSKYGQIVTTWLGYSNSTLNPLIYSVFNPDLRNAFRKRLISFFCKRNKTNGISSDVYQCC